MNGSYLSGFSILNSSFSIRPRIHHVSNCNKLGAFYPVPFGIGKHKPKHFREMLRVAWDNRDNLGYAWRILNHGVCDGCSLGPRGLKDDVIEGTHLCLTRLNLLRLNTMPAMTPADWQDIEKLRRMSNTQLHNLGRLCKPLIRQKGDKGFRAIDWSEAYKTIADAFGATSPERIGFFVTSRGITNESYYVAQKFARMLGTNNVDLCARLCHAATVAGLKDTLGVAAPTCSLSDMLGTDLLVLFGTDLANNQPVTVKYMHYAKKAGTKIIVVNPYREPGLERYWVPSIPSSAVFGTKLMDDFFQVNVGGDIALMTGVLKKLIDLELVNKQFIDAHTADFDAVREHCAALRYDDLVRRSGISEARMEQFARDYGRARSAVFVYSMGLTQHRFGVDNVKALVNLVLARGNIGREKCGIMPIRGHSGVQGGGECGVDPGKFCGGFPINDDNCKRFEQLWGCEHLPREHGMRTFEMLHAAHDGQLDVLYNVGGNLLHTMPDTDYMQTALERVKLRVHQDIVFNESTLLDAGETVLVLPAKTRYEQQGGGTSTSTERRVRYSPEIPGPRIADAKEEWRIFAELAQHCMPNGARSFAYKDGQDIREDMDRTMPVYKGIAELKEEGQHFQWGGPFLLKDGVCDNMPDGKGRFTVVPLPDSEIPAGKFLLMTRRGKQFNSIVHKGHDILANGWREDLFFNPDDAAELNVRDGDRVQLTNETGTFEGTCRIRSMASRCIAAYWPEVNVLIPRRMDEVSGEPDYNAVVEVRRA